MHADTLISLYIGKFTKTRSEVDVVVNLENRRHQESPKTDMHPPNTPQTTVSPYKIISENTRLAEMRFLLFPPLNRPQTLTKLVLNRAFQVDTNADRHLRWAAMLPDGSACLRQARPVAWHLA